MLDLGKLVAIDIHTHAEEPCGMHGDDGYDDFQAQMAEYFKSPQQASADGAGDRGLLPAPENRGRDLSRSMPSARPDFAATTTKRCGSRRRATATS